MPRSTFSVTVIPEIRLEKQLSEIILENDKNAQENKNKDELINNLSTLNTSIKKSDGTILETECVNPDDRLIRTIDKKPLSHTSIISLSKPSVQLNSTSIDIQSKNE